MALGKRTRPEAPLIHHSDRGLQYCSKDYVGLLTEHQVQISMTENGDPYENAIAERVNGILKEEFYLGETFRSHQQTGARRGGLDRDLQHTAAAPLLPDDDARGGALTVAHSMSRAGRRT